jgi:hypothetical protein
LQRCGDGLERAGSTYSRSSRRMAAHPETVPPGVGRDGWILNVILDTSGSMREEAILALEQLKGHFSPMAETG